MAPPDDAGDAEWLPDGAVWSLLGVPGGRGGHMQQNCQLRICNANVQNGKTHLSEQSLGFLAKIDTSVAACIIFLDDAEALLI